MNFMQAMSRIQHAARAARDRRPDLRNLGVRVDAGKFQVCEHVPRGGVLEPAPLSEWTDAQGAIDFLNAL